MDLFSDMAEHKNKLAATSRQTRRSEHERATDHRFLRQLGSYQKYQLDKETGGAFKCIRKAGRYYAEDRAALALRRWRAFCAPVGPFDAPPAGSLDRFGRRLRDPRDLRFGLL